MTGPRDLFVAPGGDDAAPGTREAPLAPMERARDRSPGDRSDRPRRYGNASSRQRVRNGSTRTSLSASPKSASPRCT